MMRFEMRLPGHEIILIACLSNCLYVLFQCNEAAKCGGDDSGFGLGLKSAF